MWHLPAVELNSIPVGLLAKLWLFQSPGPLNLQSISIDVRFASSTGNMSADLGLAAANRLRIKDIRPGPG